MISVKSNSWKGPCTPNCCHGLRILTIHHLFRMMLMALGDVNELYTYSQFTRLDKKKT